MTIGTILFILFIAALWTSREKPVSAEIQDAMVKDRVRELSLFDAQQRGVTWKDPYDEIFIVTNSYGDPELVDIRDELKQLDSL